MKIIKINRQDVKRLKLVNKIIEIDKRNMREFFTASEIENSLKNRIKSFNDPGILILAHFKNKIIGYFEYGSDWNDLNNIFVSSLQILPDFRNKMIFKKLLKEAKNDLDKKDFKYLVSGVQKSNINAVKIYKKLGFDLYEKSDKPGSYKVIGLKEKILSRW